MREREKGGGETVKAKKPRIKTNAEIFMGMRKDWGTVNPVTKVIPNKKKDAEEPAEDSSEFDFYDALPPQSFVKETRTVKVRVTKVEKLQPMPVGEEGNE